MQSFTSALASTKVPKKSNPMAVTDMINTTELRVNKSLARLALEKVTLALSKTTPTAVHSIISYRECELYRRKPIR